MDLEGEQLSLVLYLQLLFLISYPCYQQWCDSSTAGSDNSSSIFIDIYIHVNIIFEYYANL